MLIKHNFERISNCEQCLSDDFLNVEAFHFVRVLEGRCWEMFYTFNNSFTLFKVQLIHVFHLLGSQYVTCSR